MRFGSILIILFGIANGLNAQRLEVGTFVMTQGGPLHRTTTVTYQIWTNAFTFYRMGFSTALAFILFGITVVISILNAKVFQREINY